MTGLPEVTEEMLDDVLVITEAGVGIQFHWSRALALEVRRLRERVKELEPDARAHAELREKVAAAFGPGWPLGGMKGRLVKE